MARVFDHFVLCKYPASLNRLLLHPLYKGKGPLTHAASYRPISLIHPIGRWFAKCVATRLEAATLAHRAMG